MRSSQSVEIGAVVGAWIFVATLVYLVAMRFLAFFHHIDGTRFQFYERWWFSPLERFRVAHCFAGSGINVCVPPFSQIKRDKKGRPIAFSMNEIEHCVEIKAKHGPVQVQYTFVFVFEIDIEHIEKFINANDFHHVEKATFPVLANQFEKIAREYLENSKHNNSFSNFSMQTPTYYADQIYNATKECKTELTFGIKLLRVTCDPASGGTYILVPTTANDQILKAIGKE